MGPSGLTYHASSSKKTQDAGCRIFNIVTGNQNIEKWGSASFDIVRIQLASVFFTKKHVPATSHETLL